MHDENMAIVKSLVTVAWADGEFAEPEREMVEALIDAFQATEDEAKAIRDFAAEKRTIDDIPLTELSADDRRVLVQHAVLLSYIDGEQHAAEVAYLDALCKKLRIPDDEAKALIDSADARAKKFLAFLD